MKFFIENSEFQLGHFKYIDKAFCTITFCDYKNNKKVKILQKLFLF